MTLQLNYMPDIDYEAHPAFTGLSCATDEVNALAETLIAEIDGAYEATQKADNPEDTFDRIVTPRIAALAKLAKNQAIPVAFAPFLACALDLARDTMRKNMAARAHNVSNSATESVPDELCHGLNTFHRDGFFQTCIPSLAEKVWSNIWIERAILRARSTRDPRRHATVALHPGSPAVRAIRFTAKESGLEALISAYLGKPAAFYYAALDYAHPEQQWFRGCYAAEGLDDSKTAYMHVDADADIIKAMFYLNNVTEKDGPFCFVRGSHRWNRSPFQMAIRKGFDQASTTTFPTTIDQLDFVQGYYRPRFQTTDYKAGMLALPRALRGSTHFGDDVLDGSMLSNALLRDEHCFIAPAGAIVVFDGSRGIHRGSLTQAGGERWALQLAFKVRTETALADDDLPRDVLCRRLSYFKHTAVSLLRLAEGEA